MYIFLSIVCPIIILITGYLLKTFPPKGINSAAGYRTCRSMKNIDTWNEANKYSTRLLINLSWLTILISLINAIILGEAYRIVEVFVSLALTIISLIIIIVLTEKHLINTFGK